MNKFSVSSLVFLCAAAVCGAADDGALPLESGSFHDRYLAGRLSIGATALSTSLTDAKRPEDKGAGKTFVGFIYKLEDDHATRLVPTVSYYMPEYMLRASLSWDSVYGRTRNYNKTRHSDGVVKTQGPSFLLEVAYPFLDDTLIAHAGVGFVAANSDFTEDTWWRLGFSSEEAWKARGAPSHVSRGARLREIRVDDVFAPMIGGGLSWRPVEHLELDLSARYVKMEPDCEFGYSHGGRFSRSEKGEFTLDHASVAATVSYVF